MALVFIILAAVIVGAVIGGAVVWAFTKGSAQRLARDAGVELARAQRLHQEVANRPHPLAELVAWAEGSREKRTVKAMTAYYSHGTVFCGNIPVPQRKLGWLVEASETGTNKSISASATADLSTACQKVLKELGA